MTQKNAARVTASNRALALEQAKAPHEQRLDEARQRIESAEQEAVQQVENVISGKRAQLDEALGPLQVERGVWEERKRAPAASVEALANIEVTSKRLSQHTEARSEAAEVLSKTKSDQFTARQAFDNQERTIREAKRLLEAAAQAVEKARLHLAPNPGSLLATLRAHSDDSWKRTLAKVIHPALLERDDLDAQMLEEGDQTAYGWHLNTGIIAAPQWADDELARRALETEQAREAAAKEHLNKAEAQLAQCADSLSRADRAVNEAQAGLDILDGQTEGLKTALAVARQRAEKERREATTQAETELARLKGHIEGVLQQQRGLNSDRDAELANVRKAHAAQRKQAQQARDAAIQEIERNRNTVVAELDAHLRELDSQLGEHLSAHGVDPKRLQDLRSRVAELGGEVSTREDKQSLVAAWKQWNAEGGHPHLEELRAKHQSTKVAWEQAAAHRHDGPRGSGPVREHPEISGTAPPCAVACHRG